MERLWEAQISLMTPYWTRVGGESTGSIPLTPHRLSKVPSSSLPAPPVFPQLPLCWLTVRPSHTCSLPQWAPLAPPPSLLTVLGGPARPPMSVIPDDVTG